MNWFVIDPRVLLGVESDIGFNNYRLDDWNIKFRPRRNSSAREIFIFQFEELNLDKFRRFIFQV